VTAGAVRSTGLTVHAASQVEDLLGPLVERLRDPAQRPADPFVPITIMVQSLGMQRWLSHHLAERLDDDGRGIATTLDFTFPGKIVDRIVAACLPDATEDGGAWASDRLPWPLLAAIREHADHPSLQRLTHYLGGDQVLRAAVIDRRAWRFARNVADVFDRYVLHRSEMVTRWAAGDDVAPDGATIDERDAWQPHLWRALVERHGDPTERLSRAIQVLRDAAHPDGRLPDATIDAELPLPLVTFGISGLPPRQLDLLAALASRHEVTLFLPTASTSRWEAIAAATADGQEPPEPHHPLLVSCGALLDDAAALLVTTEPRWTAHTRPSDLPPDDGAPTATLLHRLQAAIRADAAPAADLHLDVAEGRATDASVQIHACHGPARQAEVLRDVLLGLFADDPTLQPRDVLVMTPDIDGYAPLIQAAFAATDHVPEVPVSVADRQVGRTNPVADVLLAALDLGTGRVTATQVLDLLGRDPVLTRFGLSLDDLGTVAGWIDATGIRWGIDDAHRARHGQPADRAHTWRFGLDRLLLGAAMADEGHRIVGDVVPFDDVEGGDVEVAGRVADACATLFRFVDEAQEPTDLDGWVDRCTTLLRDLVAVPSTERWRVQEVRQQLEALRGLDHLDDATGVPRPLCLDLPAARAVVEGSLGGTRGAAGYETGAVTLCALVPMRSIPHRVVVLLGMDDGQLPRGNVRLGFDLQDRYPARGDRDRRGEDRSLFLEAILAARQHLIVTTTGQDVRTGEERPPAVPLAELLDVLDASATVDGDRTVRDVITRTHPLQAFSPRNFGDGAGGGSVTPFGFDPVARDAAERVRDPRRRRPVLLTAPLPPRAVDPDDVDSPDPAVVRLDDLAAALYHPTELLLTRRLGIGLKEYTTEVDDLEPITLAPLTAASLGRALLRSPDGLASIDRWRAATLATGATPAGTPGQVSLTDLGDEVRHLLEAGAVRIGATGWAPDVVSALTGGQRRDLDVTIGDRRIVGEVDGVHERAGMQALDGVQEGDGVPVDGAGGRVIRLFLAYVRPRPEQLLRAWVAHLALTAAGTTALDTWVVTRGPSGARNPVKERHLGPLAEDPDEASRFARELLTDLVALYDRAWCELLPLFPKASHAYADKGDMGSARTAFEPSYWALGDAGDLDEATVHVYGDELGLEDVLDLLDGGPDAGDDAGGARAEFARLAELVWGRLLAHEQASAP
jgi:exodeoxyribonuclease V gamma subunit